MARATKERFDRWAPFVGRAIPWQPSPALAGLSAGLDAANAGGYELSARRLGLLMIRQLKRCGL